MKSLSVLRRNILANFGGQAATTIIAFVTVPLYVRYLGTEGYGLVSFMLTLQALTSILDFGLSTTANREVSRYLAQNRGPSERSSLVRTLEVFYVATGTLLFLLIAAAAPWLSVHWFRTTQFDAPTLRTCLLIAAGSLALRWPTALYQGILRGTEQQVTLNLINTATSLIRGAGTILVLLFIARTVLVFYWWQLFFSLVELAVCVAVVSRTASGFSGWSGRYQWPILRDLWRFSAKVGGLSLFALVLKQLDKVVISKLLPISHLGFYNAASLASNGIVKVTQPVQTAVFPRLTQLREKQDVAALATTFHRSCQLTAFLSVPIACVFLFFAHDVLWLWTRNAELATHAAAPLAILAAAMMLNSMMSVPFSLQLAAGIPWLPLTTNAIGAIALAPLIYFGVKVHGLAGGAYAWLIFNFVYYLVVPPIMFRHVLRGHYRAYVTRDTLPFMLVGIACIGAARWAAADAGLLAKTALVTGGLLAYAVTMVGANAELRVAVMRSPLAVGLTTRS